MRKQYILCPQTLVVCQYGEQKRLQMNFLSKLIVSCEGFTEIGRLWPNKEVILVEDFFLGEFLVSIRIWLIDKVPGFCFSMIKIWRDDPIFHLEIYISKMLAEVSHMSNSFIYIHIDVLYKIINSIDRIMPLIAYLTFFVKRRIPLFYHIPLPYP